MATDLTVKTKGVEHDPFEGPEIGGIAPCTESQIEILTACLLGGSDACLAFNESITLKLLGPLDRAAIESAFQKLIHRHESLRSAFNFKHKQVCIFSNPGFHLSWKDISGEKEIGKQQFVKDYLQQESLHLFDLVNGPLFKAGIIKLNADEHNLVITAHHIICDGWSLGIILQDLGKLYSAHVQNKVIDLPAPVSISQFAREQNNFLKTETYQQIEKYWVDQYKDDIPVTDLPVDFPRPIIRSYKSNRIDYQLDNSLVVDLKKLGKNTGCSLVTIFLATFETFLYRLTGQDNIVTGLPAAGQSVTGNYHLVGHCVNLLPLRSNPGAEISFLDYLGKRRIALLDAYDHQQLTFSSLIKKLKIQRDPSRIPLVPVVFNIDMGMDDGVDFFGLQYQLGNNPRSYENFELFLNISGSEKGLTLECSFNTQLFTPITINGMMSRFENLLRTIVINPSIALGNIELSKKRTVVVDTTQQKKEVAIVPNGQQQPTIDPEALNLKKKEATVSLDKVFDEYQINNMIGVSVIDLFEEQAATHPNNIALVIDEQRISYKDLAERSNQLAHYLAGKGVKGEMLVPICIERGLNMIVGILGILKAGGAYVPIDPAYPQERINFILKDTNAKMVVVSRETLIKFPGNEINLIRIDSEWPIITKESTGQLKINIQPANLAYLIYTSGSTGKPKGVMVEHKALAASTLSRKDYYGNMGAMLLIPSFAFDSSVAVIFGTLITGGKLILCHEHEIKETEAVKGLLEHAQSLLCVPSFYRFLLNNGLTKNARLASVILAGEKLDASLVKTHFEQNHNASLYNEYGPTEATVWSTVASIENADSAVTIGKPVNSVKMYILNQDLLPVAPGVTGQLCIGGLQVARGYLNQPELTAEKFTLNPHSSDLPERIYQTGDMGRWLANGEIEYQGRVDDQVKIRGYRIELGEIEQVLMEHREIKEAVVLAKDDNRGNQLLLGFIVPVNTLNKEMISAYLLAKIPEYMVPAIWVELEKLPLTLNGKTDKKALLNIDTTRLSNQPLQAPRNEQEAMLATIWNDLLEVENPCIHDDFFELGGHSLVAIELMARIEKLSGKRLPPSTLFQYPTIAKLATVLDGAASINKWKSLVPIKPYGNKDPLYIIHGSGLDVMVFRNFTKHLDINQPVYGIKAKGKDGDGETLEVVEEMAAFYISEIIQQNPTGPYALVGFSAGAVLAFEIARQLISMGREVKMLGNIDFDLGEMRMDYSFIQKIKIKTAEFFPRFFHVAGSFMKHPKKAYKFQVMCLRLIFGTILSKLGLDKETKLQGLYLNITDAMRKYEFALKNYSFTPADIRLHLFSTEIKVYYLKDKKYLGWQPYALKGIEIHKVPGDHDDMLLSPNDKEFAEILQKVLDNPNKK